MSIKWRFVRLQKSKELLKVCFENVYCQLPFEERSILKLRLIKAHYWGELVHFYNLHIRQRWKPK